MVKKEGLQIFFKPIYMEAYCSKKQKKLELNLALKIFYYIF